jgi:ubiquinol-cytochrome c reductase cytochrome b subunit
VKLGDWLDERTGWRALVRGALDEPVPGGARWAYVFGSVLVFLLLMQLASGVVLAAFYSPSSTDAWASVAYLQTQVSLGWFLRGIHSTGASAIMIVTDLHLLQVTLYGAYRKPREVNWWIGLALLGVMFAFALTGYLLPWDQKGYWATQVATSLLGATPGIGPAAKRLVQGGAAYGNLTLTHFYALHVLALPLTAALLAIVHVKLMRRHGITPGWQKSEEELRASTAPFWPDQLARDFVAMAIVLAIMVGWTLREHGASLDAPADPASAYDARPEWYFLPLYQLLKYFPGPLEIVAALGAPLIAGALLFALPLFDRGASRDPRARWPFVALVVTLLGAAGGLGLQAQRDDARNQRYREFRARADEQARRALTLAQKGVPIAGGTAVWDNDPLVRGRRLFAERCATCHVLGGVGERKAPDLDGWSSRGWLRAFLKDPANDRFYGKTKIRGMKPVKAEGADFDALADWLYDNASAPHGKEVFDNGGCDDCHGDGDGAPDLAARATPEWIRKFLEDPSDAHFFDGKNDMPKFRGKLSEEDFAALVELLRAERAR